MVRADGLAEGLDGWSARNVRKAGPARRPTYVVFFCLKSQLAHWPRGLPAWPRSSRPVELTWIHLCGPTAAQLRVANQEQVGQGVVSHNDRAMSVGGDRNGADGAERGGLYQPSNAPGQWNTEEHGPEEPRTGFLRRRQPRARDAELGGTAKLPGQRFAFQHPGCNSTHASIR